jgi:hypothetical protein
VGSLGTGVTGVRSRQGQVPGLYWNEGAVAKAVQGELAAHQRDTGSDSHGDRADGGAVRREGALLDSTGRYYRLNMVPGLEQIGMKEARKVEEIAAAARKYISSQKTHRQMQACASSIPGREC